jgi:hypothetical protein
MTEPLKPTDNVTFQELANLFYIPVEFVIAAVETQRRNKPFYTFRELSLRWDCSAGTIYNLIEKYDVKTMHLGRGKNRGKHLIPVEAVERIEQRSMKFMP